jgi:hypothetical protein
VTPSIRFFWLRVSREISVPSAQCFAEDVEAGVLGAAGHTSALYNASRVC